MTLPLWPEFDDWRVPLGEQLKEEGMDHAEIGADEDWLRHAFDALLYVARRRLEFTADAIWAVLEYWHIPLPREPRALGPVVSKACKRGLIELTDRTSKSVRPDCHRRPITIYRSLVYGR